MRLLKVLIIGLLSLDISTAQLQFVRQISPDYPDEGLVFENMVVSSFGVIYLTESTRHEVYRLDRKGKILGRNGGFGWEKGNLDTPFDLSLSTGLDVFVADYNNHRIARYDRLLNFLAVFPESGQDYGLLYPRSLAVSSQGEIFILEEDHNEILRIEQESRELIRFAGIGYGTYALKNPLLIRINSQGILHILEEAGTILRYDRFGTPLGRISNQLSKGSHGLVLLKNNILLFSVFCYTS